MTTPAQAPLPNGKPASATQAPAKTAAPAVPTGRAGLRDRSDDLTYDVKLEAAQNSPWKKAAAALLGIVVLGSGYYAWQHSQATHPPSQPASQAAAADQASDPAPDLAADSLPAPPVAPKQTGDQSLVHEQLRIKDYQAFAFEIPARTVHPHVHGQFQTVALANHAAATVDILLMNEQQYEDFSQHRLSDSTFAQEGAKSGDIDWLMHPTFDDAQKYYLVFATSEKGDPASVKADFVVSLE